MPCGTKMWKTTTPDADVMFWWFKTHGYTHLGVAIGREGQSSPVSDAQASKILSSFLGVTEFWEIKEGPESLRKKYPTVRVWRCVPTYLKEIVRPLRERLPRYEAPKLSARQRLLRAHLFPEKLPTDWSPPVAQRVELDDGTWLDAWTVIIDDLFVVASIAIGGPELLRLAVTIVGAPEELPDEVRCASVLASFRGVGDFRECDSHDPMTRMYVGELLAGEPMAPEQLN
jgi:hypothetical protein